MPDLQYLADRHLDSSDRTDRSNWLTRVRELANSDFGDFVSQRYSEPSDPATLRSIIETHGVFGERFFRRNIHPSVVRRYARHNVEWQHIENLLSFASGYKCTFYSKSDAIFSIIDHIFNMCIIELMRDLGNSLFIDAWLDKNGATQECELCGNVFRLIDLPGWVYFGGNGYKKCCFGCLIVEQPRKGELLTLVPEFVDTCGFIPTSAAGPIEYSFTSRISTERWTSVMISYARMGGVGHVTKKYGSWFRALAETSALPEGVLTTARGIRCLSKDKHVCHSLDEQRIDNWLFERDINHEREPFYPTHVELNPSGRRRADWQVGDFYIEYFGLVGDPNYDKKMDEKLQLAELCDIDMIPIYPEDIDCLERKLGRLEETF